MSNLASEWAAVGSVVGSLTVRVATVSPVVLRSKESLALEGERDGATMGPEYPTEREGLFGIDLAVLAVSRRGRGESKLLCDPTDEGGRTSAVLVLVAMATVARSGVTVVRTTVGVVLIVTVLRTTVGTLRVVVVRGTRARSSSIETLGTGVVDLLNALIDPSDGILLVRGREGKGLHADGLAVVSLERELQLEDGDEQCRRVGELEGLDFNDLGTECQYSREWKRRRERTLTNTS